jgi:transposase
VLEMSKKFESEEIKQLKEENQHLRKENRELKKELKELKMNIKEIVAIAVNEAVAQATEPLKQELAKANEEITRLKAIINKDSSNSSKPSSTNHFKHIPNSREKTGRKQGGQKGHPGHRLSLPGNLEELEAKGIIHRRVKDHTKGAAKYVQRYTIDLETKVVITEHRYKKGEVPAKMYNEVTYGKEIKGMSVVLMNEGIIAKHRLKDIISGMSSGLINLSTGTLESFQKEFASKLTNLNEVDAIETDLLNGHVMHSDDTPLRVLERPVQREGKLVYRPLESGGTELEFERGESKTLAATMRTYANERSTRYTINPSKHREGIDRDDILPRFHGIVSHDDESKFHHYGSDNALCCAHLLRALKGLSELYKCRWAKKMKNLFIRMNDYKIDDLKNEITSCDKRKLKYFEQYFKNVLKEGNELLEKTYGYEALHKPLRIMLNKLEKRKDNYLLFIRNYEAPFTNNRAEASLRAEKIKQKVSGMFRSWKNILIHADIRSFIATLKKRNINIFNSINNIFDDIPVLAL